MALNALLTDLATRLGERWGAKLALPGLAFLAAIFAAVSLRHGHALDLDRLAADVTDTSDAVGKLDAGSTALAVIGLTAGAVGVAFLARAIGSLLQRSWFTDADSARMARLLPVSQLGRLRRSLLEDYKVDLATVWPPLWMHLSSEDRQEVALARAAVRDGATLIGWALLSAVLAVVWWPMTLIAAILAVEGRRRSNVAMQDFTQTVKAVVQLHTAELATRLGLTDPQPLDRSLGWRLTAHLQNNRLFEVAEKHRNAT
ncbi:hypothetical protein FB566_1865 [Stackebrandtia endophytica]|uniref:Uncharacterized protein n=1 Tax=Stackebrandtia endophytica TaxID=1496996 RepID=A0A543AUS1_9ACTN|nr:hypothetical protein [Stackebrandtia endophytica]TQL76338.1 hypothetical protein FB566_1865 [Stackebrandtia endophytica]